MMEVEEEFASFNNDVRQLQKIHKEVFGSEFDPREPLDWEGKARKVPCVSHVCGKVLPLNQLLEHVDGQHGGVKLMVDRNGLVQRMLWQTVEIWNVDDVTWGVNYFHYSGHTFICRIIKHRGIYHIYVRIMADKDVAKQFNVDLKLVNPISKANIKIPGMKIYPIDTKWQDVIKDIGGVLSFHQLTAEKLFTFDDIGKEYKTDVRCKINKI